MNLYGSFGPWHVQGMGERFLKLNLLLDNKIRTILIIVAGVDTESTNGLVGWRAIGVSRTRNRRMTGFSLLVSGASGRPGAPPQENVKCYMDSRYCP